jgi:hypothetical protein
MLPSQHVVLPFETRFFERICIHLQSADIQIELLKVLMLKFGNQRSQDVTARETIK